MVCYYGSWAVVRKKNKNSNYTEIQDQVSIDKLYFLKLQYRPGNGKFDVEHIDPQICTHLIYGFVGLSPTNEILTLVIFKCN